MRPVHRAFSPGATATFGLGEPSTELVFAHPASIPKAPAASAVNKIFCFISLPFLRCELRRGRAAHC
jgi:hypothetical protein